VSRDFWFVLGATAVAATGGWFWWRKENEVQDLIDKLTDALPGRIGQWARQIAVAARGTHPGDVDELRWGLVLGAIMDRESAGGKTLSPPGPAGTGDQGHGRGLMQIDDRSHPEFTAGEGWKDPETNITYAAKLLRSLYDAGGGDLGAAVAAYNAGPRALKLTDPDVITTGRNYSADVLARADSYAATLGELPT
jgi:Transglycosylase SLT domain